MNKKLKAALEYSKEGFSIFPIGANKNPLVEWKEFQTRLATEDEIHAWWKEWPNANIGIATGKLSNLVVLDCDGPRGLEIIEMNGGLPLTPCVFTSYVGKFRKRQYYFHYPDFEARNFAKAVGIAPLPELDFRAEGGYVVAPPSVHPSGVTYEWEPIENVNT